MIFEQADLSFHILDVLFLDQANVKSFNTNRHFDALSFRYEADTVIETPTQQIEVSGNSVGFFPANVSYSRTSRRDRMIVVHFKLFGCHSDRIEYFYPEDPAPYRALFSEILDCWQKKEPSVRYDASAILNRIFSALYRENRKNAPARSKIAESVRYIEENYSQKDFSLPLAVKRSFISEPYFRRLFRAEFGTSPKQYVIKKRISCASSLILTGYYSLEEVADLCGYADYKHFSAEFKKHMGVSPSKYAYVYRDPS